MNNNISGFFIFPFSFFYHFTMLSCFWKMNALISDNGKTFIICLKPVWQQCKFFVDLRKMQIHALTKSWTLLPHSPWRFNIFIFVGYDNSSASFVGFSRMWLFADSMRARSHPHYRHWKFDICLLTVWPLAICHAVVSAADSCTSRHLFTADSCTSPHLPHSFTASTTSSSLYLTQICFHSVIDLGRVWGKTDSHPSGCLTGTVGKF